MSPVGGCNVTVRGLHRRIIVTGVTGQIQSVLTILYIIGLIFFYMCTVSQTRKPSCRWQTRATRNYAINCTNSTCLQRCRWQYWPICIRFAVVESKVCEIPRNSLKIQTYGVQGHPRSSILVSMESPHVDFILVINSNFSRICYCFRDIHG